MEIASALGSFASIIIDLLPFILLVAALGGGYAMFAKLFPSTAHDSSKGACGTKAQGGLSQKTTCLKDQITFCLGQGGGQNTTCFTDRGIKMCTNPDMDCVDGNGKPMKCPCYPDDVPCSGFGNYDSTLGKCGTDTQGGKKCAKDCCAVQWNGKGDWTGCKNAMGGAKVKCMKDRGCTMDTNECNTLDYRVDGTVPALMCGGSQKGGTLCKPECCTQQWNGSGLWSGCKNALGGGKAGCMKDRGCGIDSSMCSTLDYRVDGTVPALMCGGWKKGGETCKQMCCDKQWYGDTSPLSAWGGCKNAVFCDDACKKQCLKDRGCANYTPTPR